jgi:hypothetical protein
MKQDDDLYEKKCIYGNYDEGHEWWCMISLCSILCSY